MTPTIRPEADADHEAVRHVTNTKAQALYERDGWRRDTAFLHYEYQLPKDGR